MVELPWPAGTKIPRWARGRRGRLREPDLQSHMQLDNLDRYHVALFRTSGLFPHVVEIIEPAGAGQGSRVTITTVWWPKDPLAAFQAAEAKYVGLSLYFDEHRNQLVRLGGMLAALATDECPFDPSPLRAVTRLARWVRPELVAEIQFAEWTSAGTLRHPSYLGTRDDKNPRSVARES